VRCVAPRQGRRWRTKERHDHQQQGVKEQYDPVGCADVVEHDVVVSPHLSDEQEREGVGEIGRPERDEAIQQVPVVSRWPDLQYEEGNADAKTPSLNATNRVVSRRTEGESAPALPSGDHAIASQRTQRITGETPAAPPRATHVGHPIDEGPSARVPRRRRGRTGGCRSQIEHRVVVRP
jgi:hypothetical protein